MIKVLVLTEHEIAAPEELPSILEAVNAPELPHFAGTVRVVVGQDAEDCIRWLDE